MAENLGTLSYTVDANTAPLLKAQKQVNTSVNSMSRTLGTGAKAADKMTASTKKMGDTSGRAAGQLGELKGIVASIGLAVAAQKVVAYTDAWTGAQNALRQVTDSQRELNSVTEALMSTANNTRSSFSSTANLYSRLARSTTELGISQDRLIGLTKTINQSFASSGATATEAAAAITQLSQGLASGTLRGDEFNSVAEQAPDIMRAIADSLDMTVGELRTFAAEGGITSQIVVDALEQAADTIDGRFGKAVVTFGQQTTVANNNLTEFIGTSGAVQSVVTAAGNSLVFFTENLDGVVEIAQLATTVIGVRLIQALTAYIARTAAATLGTASLTAGLSAMGARAAATTIVMRGLSASMALIGGPAGVAALAAFGIYKMVTAMNQGEQQAQATKQRIAELTEGIDDMSAAVARNKITELKTQLIDIEKSAEKARAKVKAAQDQVNKGSGGGALGISASAISGYSTAITKLSELNTEAKATSGAIEDLEQHVESLASGGMSEQAKAVRDAKRAYAQLRQGFDPVGTAADALAATQKALNLLLREGEISAIDFTLAMNQAQKVYEKAAAKEKEFGASGMRDAAQAAREYESALESAMSEFSSLKEEFDPAGAAIDEFNEKQKQLKMLLDAGKISAENYAKAVNVLRISLQQGVAEGDMSGGFMGQAETGGVVANPNGGPQQMSEQDLAAQKIQQITDLSATASQKLAELQQQAKDPAEAVMDSMVDIFTTLDDQMGQTLGNAIVQGTSLKEAFASVGEEVLSSVVGSLIQVATQMALNAALSTGLQATQATQAAATGSAMTAAYAPAAATASIASFGGAAAAGLAGMAAAIPAMLGLVSGGRQYGGQVGSGQNYEVNETGRPEILTTGGSQYLTMPRGQSGQVTPIGSGGMGGNVNVIINNNAAGTEATASETTGDDGERTVTIAVNKVAEQIRRNTGAVASALNSSTDIKRKTR